MRILVTGSSGQIGTNLALRPLADGHEVFGVDQRVDTWAGELRWLLDAAELGVTRLEHRSTHPEENQPVAAEPAIGWKTLVGER